MSVDAVIANYRANLDRIHAENRRWIANLAVGDVIAVGNGRHVIERLTLDLWRSGVLVGDDLAAQYIWLTCGTYHDACTEAEYAEEKHHERLLAKSGALMAAHIFEVTA